MLAGGDDDRFEGLVGENGSRGGRGAQPRWGCRQIVSVHPRWLVPRNLGLEDSIPLGFAWHGQQGHSAGGAAAVGGGDGRADGRGGVLALKESDNGSGRVKWAGEARQAKGRSIPLAN